MVLKQHKYVCNNYLKNIWPAKYYSGNIFLECVRNVCHAGEDRAANILFLKINLKIQFFNQ